MLQNVAFFTFLSFKINNIVLLPVTITKEALFKVQLINPQIKAYIIETLIGSTPVHSGPGVFGWYFNIRNANAKNNKYSIKYPKHCTFIVMHQNHNLGSEVYV